MSRKAKLISTGEIVEVHVDMDYHGNTTWLDTLTKTEYYTSELEFLQEDPKPIERRSQFPPNIRCRDCKHCVKGLAFKHQYIPTTVCRMNPKPSQGSDRYYSTVCSLRACDKFEAKTQ